MEERVRHLLRSHGHSTTKSRMSILGALLRLQPVAMRQMIASLPHIDRATIYRNIDLFVSLGIAKKVYTGFKYRVEVGDNFQSHHHHLTCLNCGLIVDFTAPSMEIQLDSLALASGFQAINHEFEISGYCRDCH